MAKAGKILFNPGQILITPGAMERLVELRKDPTTFLTRHLAGDWGDVDAHDKAANDQALEGGTRLLSAYTLPGGNHEKIWVITEWDRSATTILLPDEY